MDTDKLIQDLKDLRHNVEVFNSALLTKIDEALRELEPQTQTTTPPKPAAEPTPQPHPAATATAPPQPKEKPAYKKLEEALEALPWKPMKTGGGEWAFGTTQEGETIEALKPYEQTLLGLAKAPLRTEDYEYSVSVINGHPKFIRRKLLPAAKR